MNQDVIDEGVNPFNITKHDSDSLVEDFWRRTYSIRSLRYLYLPKGVTTVAKYQLSTNAICMKPDVASNVLKYLELCSFANISSAVGTAKCSRFIAALSDHGSKHILND